MTQSTPDICDEFPDAVHVLDGRFASFGALEAFHGSAVTVRCFEDNSRVKELAATPGEGRVMVVAGGGSLHRALLGDLIAANAANNGWAGFVIDGAVRDVDILRTLNLGIRARGAVPRKTERRGLGEVGIPVLVGGVTIHPGDRIFADATGIVLLPPAN
ncbi:MAG: ribonuclease E activity regulator RraA [Bifidobacteriaceae bacterium]|jgi:regulator of ribonuclease activity A|nr:ribonuclease E activity regulator RraA [Bifidobacteriaceae bacterium]